MKTRNTIRIAVVAVALSLAGPASADVLTGQVVGRVLDADTGKAVAGATVTATSPGWIPQVVTTDARGNYVLTLLPPAIYSVTVHAPGYGKTLERDVRVMLDWRSRSDFRLLAATAARPEPAPALAQNR
jgi:hypothetical protein